SAHSTSTFLCHTHFCLPASGTHRTLHSFPTRRSSDLQSPAWRHVRDVRLLSAEDPDQVHEGDRHCRREKKTQKRVREAPVMGKSDRKSTRLNSSHQIISYAVFCLKKKR